MGMALKRKKKKNHMFLFCFCPIRTNMSHWEEMQFESLKIKDRNIGDREITTEDTEMEHSKFPIYI